MGSRYKGSKDRMRAFDAFIKLVRAADSLSGRLESHFAPLKLTASQFGVLEALFHTGPLYQKELIQKILKSSGNITMVVDNLEKRRLVQRIRDEQDRRRYSVHLTVKGRRIMKSVFRRHVERIFEEMAVLTRAEREQQSRLCRKVELGGMQTDAKRGH